MAAGASDARAVLNDINGARMYLSATDSEPATVRGQLASLAERMPQIANSLKSKRFVRGHIDDEFVETVLSQSDYLLHLRYSQEIVAEVILTGEEPEIDDEVCTSPLLTDLKKERLRLYGPCDDLFYDPERRHLVNLAPGDVELNRIIESKEPNDVALWQMRYEARLEVEESELKWHNDELHAVIGTVDWAAPGEMARFIKATVPPGLQSRLGIEPIDDISGAKVDAIILYLSPSIRLEVLPFVELYELKSLGYGRVNLSFRLFEHERPDKSGHRTNIDMVRLLPSAFSLYENGNTEMGFLLSVLAWQAALEVLLTEVNRLFPASE